MSAHKSPITCHVLVASTGIPGRDVNVKIEKMDNGSFNTLSTA
jgi:5-hydroxyisourate hydrolase